MSFFETPKPFRVRQMASDLVSSAMLKRTDMQMAGQTPLVMTVANTTLDIIASAAGDGAHSSHPNFINLAGLVCEAVLEVVFVALPGFLVAYSGMFDTNSQKFVAELNTMVFTPCLIFTKLASQLDADKLVDLAIIPFIFAAQTLVSWAGAQLMARLFGFGKKKRQKNFILAMGVFGNSNSLPISLVLSLSQTISGLHWDKIPGDNDNEVGARGILYLLIFQQLGQLLRWTWGYSVLLKPKEAYEADEREEQAEEDRSIEEGDRYRDDPDEEISPTTTKKPVDSPFGGSGRHSLQSSSSVASEDNSGLTLMDGPPLTTPANGNNIDTEPQNLARDESSEDRARSVNHITRFPTFSHSPSSHSKSTSPPTTWKGRVQQTQASLAHRWTRTKSTISTFFHNLFRRLPSPIQKTLSTIHHYNCRFWAGVWRQMNPPLWAMLAALIVASVPALQRLFFTPGTLVNNSITHAISQSGGVAVPLILVVLGANLARGTLPADQIATSPEETSEERRLLVACLLARMIIPTVVMAPCLALVAKFVPVSILDDPIFIIVCFLLTGAPSALQLAQICQLNNVFMGAMSRLLVWSYVVAIFPSTLLLVLLALEVVEWAVI